MCVVSKLIPYHVSFEFLTLIAWDGANMKFVRVFVKRQRSEALVFAERDVADVCGRKIRSLTRFFCIFDAIFMGWGEYGVSKGYS